MEKIMNWWYESNAKKSKGGMIFMIVSIAAFVGVMAWIFTR